MHDHDDEHDEAIDDAVFLDQGTALVASIVNLALVCQAGGDGRWDAMLGKLGVRGLPPDERLRHLREGPGQSKGALVLELRHALEAGVASLCEHMDEPWRLHDAVRSAVRDYVGAVKPRVSTSSIFANALATSSNPMMAGRASAQAETCRCCGAPRADRGETTCRYCGDAWT